MLVLWPDSLLDPGFQMSFAAVTALVAAFEDLAPRLTRWRQQAGPLRIALLWLLGVMAASLVAGLGSSLFAAYHFNRVADYALIANLLAAPLVDFWIMPLVVVAFILMPLGLETKPFDRLFGGDDLLIAMAPAQAQQVVAHRGCQIAHIGIGLGAERAMALGKLGAVGPMDQRDMREFGHGETGCDVKLRLPRGIGEVVVATDDMGHAHVVIVHHDRKIVGRRAVA